MKEDFIWEALQGVELKNKPLPKITKGGIRDALKDEAEALTQRYHEINEVLFDINVFNSTPKTNAETEWRKNTNDSLLAQLDLIEKKLMRNLYKQRLRAGEIIPSKDTITDEHIWQAKQVPIGNFYEFNKAGFGKSLVNPNEKTPSLKWWPKTNTFKDFSGGGESGDVIKFVMLLHNLEFIQAVKYILSQ